MAVISKTLQLQLDADEYQERTEHLPDNLSPAGWRMYMDKTLYTAVLRFGGDFDAELSFVNHKR